MLAIRFVNGVRIENVSRPILSRQFDEFIRDNNADGQRFDTDVFICRDFLRIKEIVNVRMEYVEISRARSLSLQTIRTCSLGTPRLPAAPCYHED